VEDRPPAPTYLHLHDLDLGPMTLILDADLNILKLYLRTKNEVCRSRHSNVRARTAQTCATENITTPHSQVAIKRKCLPYWMISQLRSSDCCVDID